MQKLSLYSPLTTVIYSVLLIVSSLYAWVVSTLNIFLAEEVLVRPFLIALFFIAMSLMSLVYSQSITLWVEKRVKRRPLVSAGLLCGGIACFIFSASYNYSTVLLAAITLFSLSLAAAIQLVFVADDFSQQHLKQQFRSRFNLYVRVCIGLPWLVIPPCIFYLMMGYGFQIFYFYTALSYCVVAAGLYFFMAFLQNKNND